MNLIKQNRSGFFNINLFTAFFFSLSGYYAMLILISNIASNSASRAFTIPLRVLILLSLLFLYKNTVHNKSTQASTGCFLLFSVLYVIRIGIESVGYTTHYLPEYSFLLYFLSFVFIPFYFLRKILFSEIDYQKIFHSVIIGCIAVSILTYFYYSQLIGTVSRISQEIGKDDNYISPLALSYCAVLGIGTGLSYLLTNKVTRRKGLYIFIAVIVCFIPFFLGASRGAIVAILLPFVLYFTFSKGIKNKLRFVILGFLVSGIAVYLTNYFGTGVFDRFVSISDDIDKGSTSAIRLMMWKEGLIQFADNPFFGNSLQLDSSRYYPHNIFIEVLICTGIIGFLPFITFIYLTFRRAIWIIKHHPQYFWLTSVFLISFSQNMFSGAIWNMAWLAIGAGLVLGINRKKI